MDLLLRYSNRITQTEFCEHIDDDDFFKVYGNPVVIETDEGKDLICMTVEYYERKFGEKIEIKKDKDE